MVVTPKNELVKISGFTKSEITIVYSLLGWWCHQSARASDAMFHWLCGLIVAALKISLGLVLVSIHLFLEKILWKCDACLYRNETPQLFTVLPERRTGPVGAAMMASTHIYDMSAVGWPLTHNHSCSQQRIQSSYLGCLFPSRLSAFSI